MGDLDKAAEHNRHIFHRQDPADDGSEADDEIHRSGALSTDLQAFPQLGGLQPVGHCKIQNENINHGDSGGLRSGEDTAHDTAQYHDDHADGAQSLQ